MAVREQTKLLSLKVREGNGIMGATKMRGVKKGGDASFLLITDKTGIATPTSLLSYQTTKSNSTKIKAFTVS
jgi:hypothetical protein